MSGTIFKIRRDTASNWSSENPTLSAGEMGLDQTNNFIKMGDGTTAWNSLAQFTQNIENVEDLVGAMVTSNTETFISVTYDDSDGTLDFVVPVLDEDTLATDSATHLATQQSIKAYVDSAISGGDLDFIADSGGALNIVLDSETMTFTGGTGIDTVGSGNTLTTSIDSTVTTLTGSQTLTNKTLTSPVLNTGISGTAIKDEDNMASDSATHLATQQSIKAYVDSQVDTADTVAELGDINITSAADGSMLLYDTDNSEWIDNVMSGDATMADTGAVTFATVNSNVGSFGSTTAIPVLTVNAKGLVTAASTASITTALTVGADSGSDDTVALATDTLDFSGGTGIDTTVSNNDISIAIDSTVATLAGTQTLTNKTLTTPTITSATLNTGVSGSAVKDEDNMASDSATHLATQQSIKAYVDAQVTAQDLDIAGDSGTGAIDLDSETLTIAGTSNEIETSMSGNTLTVGLPTNVTIAGNLTVAGTTTEVSSTTVNVADPMLSLATNNTGADAVDIGFYGLYDTSGSQDLYSGLFRDASDSGKWKLYKDSQSEPTTTVNVSATGHATGTLVANLEGNVTGNVVGNLTGNVTGNASGTAATVTEAAQPAITSVGTLTALQVDNININGNTISTTGGTDLMIGPVAGQQIVLDGVIEIDAGVVTGATSITSTAFVGDLTGDVTGDVSGSSGTVTSIAAHIKDEDNMASDSATHVPSQQSVKAYVDSQVTAQDLDFAADSGGSLAIDLDSEALTFTGGTGIDTSGSGNAVTFAIDSTVTTLAGTQTLTNKTLTSPVLNTGVSGSAFLDEDDLSSNSATKLASQQSIKAYVDASVTAQDLDFDADSGGSLSIDLDSEALTFTGGTGITTVGSGNVVTFNIDSTVATLTDTQTMSAKTLTSPVLNTGISGTAFLDEDNMASDSATKVASQQSIKAYVDAQVTAQDLDFQGDSGGALSIDLDSETLTIAGGTGIDTVGSGNGVTASIDATVTTLTGTQTLTNKTLTSPTVTSPVLNTGVSGSAVKDEDDMSSNSATHLATQQSIKAYVDAQTTDETAEGSSNLYFTDERVDDRVNALIVGGTNVTATYDDANNRLTISATTGASGYDLNANDTDDLSEGSSNLYYTNERAQDAAGAQIATNGSHTNITATYDDAGDGAIDLSITDAVIRGKVSVTDAGGDGSLAYNSSTGVITYTGPSAAEARAHISVTDSGGDGSLAYNSSTGVITYTGPSAAEVRAHLSAGTGVTYSGGAISIGQAVATDSDVTFDDVTVSGNLTVNGTTTTAASTNTVITDKLIELGNGQTGSPSGDLGLVFERGSSDNAFIGFDESADKFIVGTGSFTGASTGNLTITTGTMVANLEGATASLTGNITVGGTVDGRDVAADGTKLDGIEASATADQTGAQIKALYEVESSAFTDAQFTKLANIEANADVTDATNVNAAGAVMLSDTTISGMGFVVDEDNMASDSATKLATQQSIKAYVDARETAITTAYTAADDAQDHLSELGGTLDDIANGTTHVKSTNDFTDASLAKLGGIEALADVTDATNVEAAGAVMESGNNASAKIPSGTTAQRDGSPSAGFFRWNTTTSSAEIYDGSEWGLVGGGNTTGKVMWEHSYTVAENYEITSGNNALTAGPITINSGYSVTVPSGSTWVVV